jgi:drug/metabolite transporter (DMT)-like permease
MIAAFAAVYLIWGSTYLAIFYAIRTIPTFLMAGARFLVAGLILVLVAAVQGAPRPRAREVRTTAIAGVVLLCCGNGGVVWSETRAPTGSVALVVATVPLWMVVIEWVRGHRPTLGTLAGLSLGLVGIGVLVGPRALAGAGAIDATTAGVLLLASGMWAAGSLYTRYAPLPASPLLAVGLEMVSGGVALLLVAAATGEYRGFAPHRVSATSWIGLVYLVMIGSLVGFTAYIWLVRHVAPALASTYAFVNPIVAVVLGWSIAGEALTPRTALAAAVIVAAVALITAGGAAGARRLAEADSRRGPALLAPTEGSP